MCMKTESTVNLYLQVVNSLHSSSMNLIELKTTTPKEGTPPTLDLCEVLDRTTDLWTKSAQSPSCHYLIADDAIYDSQQKCNELGQSVSDGKLSQVSPLQCSRRLQDRA